MTKNKFKFTDLKNDTDRDMLDLIKYALLDYRAGNIPLPMFLLVVGGCTIGRDGDEEAYKRAVEAAQPPANTDKESNNE